MRYLQLRNELTCDEGEATLGPDGGVANVKFLVCLAKCVCLTNDHHGQVKTDHLSGHTLFQEQVKPDAVVFVGLGTVHQLPDKVKVDFQLVEAVSLGSKEHELEQFENVEEGLARGVFDLGEAKADHEDV